MILVLVCGFWSAVPDNVLSAETVAPASPPTAWLDHRDMPMYGAAPLEQAIPVIRCKDCDKPILASAVTTHKSNCEKIRKMAGKNKKGMHSTILLNVLFN